MDLLLRKVVLTELGFDQEAALDTLSLGFLRVLPVLEHVNAFPGCYSLMNLFELDESCTEAIRPLIVALVL